MRVRPGRDKPHKLGLLMGSTPIPATNLFMSFGKPERCRIEDFGPKSKKMLKKRAVKQARLDWRRKGEEAPKKRRYHIYYN